MTCQASTTLMAGSGSCSLYPGLNGHRCAHDMAVCRVRAWGEWLNYMAQMFSTVGSYLLSFDECLLTPRRSASTSLTSPTGTLPT